MRPSISYGDVVCEVCNQPCDFAEYGTHQGNLKTNGPLLTGKGEVHILASCHGSEATMSISFDVLHKMGYGSSVVKQKIVAFTRQQDQLPSPEKRIEQESHSEPARLLPGPVLEC